MGGVSAAAHRGVLRACRCTQSRSCAWGEQHGGDGGEGKGKAAHMCHYLPGQNGQVMLDTDDLEYESVYGEDDDYDEDSEMDSSEQPMMDGELPCAHLAPRMEPLGATTWLPGLCWGDASTSLLAACPHALWLGGFAALSLAPKQAACSSSHHCAAQAVQTVCSVPLTKAVTGRDGWFAGLVGPAARGRFPVLLGMSCRRGSQRPQESKEVLAAATAGGGSLWYPSKGCCGCHVPVPPPSQLYSSLCRELPWKRACPEPTFLPFFPAPGQGSEMSLPECGKPYPCSAGSHPLPSPSGVLLLCQAALHHQRAAGSCPHPRRLPRRRALQPAAGRGGLPALHAAVVLQPKSHRVPALRLQRLPGQPQPLRQQGGV